MSTKVLRSLIHERFNLDLRLELELLSRRRDIGNKEKQEELIQLLRKWHIDDIVMLGSGTNRYAFKLDGFVIKFATDHDGKIDNLKEFKMAKRLYPYVIKVHEVSENGTILVCEYITPFDSYVEMMQHADEIKEILSQLSDSYLIGDVGLSEKNYSNWGVRVGTNKPVCLDFAYVYSVSGSLFTCGYCKSHSVLLPSNDYTKLYCSNPACRKEYRFEDIRSKIGNDVHQHEIGDLSEEGYLMSASNVTVELDPSRSNYLKSGKKKVEVVEKEEVPEINFVMDKTPMEYIKERTG